MYDPHPLAILRPAAAKVNPSFENSLGVDA
jgi:hypothetical protein